MDVHRYWKARIEFITQKEKNLSKILWNWTYNITQKYYKKNFRKACIMNTYIKITFSKNPKPLQVEFQSIFKGISHCYQEERNNYLKNAAFKT